MWVSRFSKYKNYLNFFQFTYCTEIAARDMAIGWFENCLLALTEVSAGLVCSEHHFHQFPIGQGSVHLNCHMLPDSPAIFENGK